MLHPTVAPCWCTMQLHPVQCNISQPKYTQHKHQGTYLGRDSHIIYTSSIVDLMARILALGRLLTFNLHEQRVDLMARYVILCIHWSGPMWCSWDGLTPPLILKLLPLCPWKPGGRCAHMKSPLLLCGEISCSLSSFSGLNPYFAVIGNDPLEIDKSDIGTPPTTRK